MMLRVRLSSFRQVAPALGLLSLLSLTKDAVAAPDVATAEVLFQQGRDLLRAGRAVEACPKLAESQRIDPATGTLLALAMCHDAEGKLASAWAEFSSAAALSRNEGRADREEVARARAEALKPRLSTLEIRVPAAVAALSGLEIRRDNVVVGQAVWNVGTPVDGATYQVTVTAPGKVTWQHSVAVRGDSHAVVVEVPWLTAVNLTPKVVVRPSETEQPAQPSDAAHLNDAGWGGLEWTGVGVAAAGVVVLGVGGYVLATALKKHSQAKSDCDAEGCGDAGSSFEQSAHARGNTATVLGIAGGVLLAGGATLFVVGHTGRASQGERSVAGHWTGPSLSFGAGPTGIGLQLSSAF